MQDQINSLIKACKKENQVAQMQVYDNYAQAMFTIACRYLSNEEDAKDAMQEGFLKAFVNMDSYRPEATFGAWLKRIVVNTSIDALKSKKQRLVELDDVHLKVVDTDNDDKWLADDTVSIQDIKEAINQLSDKYKYVVMLYLIEGYDHQEISEILKISEVASRTQLYRGKLQLQKLLKQTQNGTGY